MQSRFVKVGKKSRDSSLFRCVSNYWCSHLKHVCIPQDTEAVLPLTIWFYLCILQSSLWKNFIYVLYDFFVIIEISETIKFAAASLSFITRQELFPLKWYHLENILVDVGFCDETEQTLFVTPLSLLLLRFANSVIYLQQLTFNPQLVLERTREAARPADSLVSAD